MELTSPTISSEYTRTLNLILRIHRSQSYTSRQVKDGSLGQTNMYWSIWWRKRTIDSPNQRRWGKPYLYTKNMIPVFDLYSKEWKRKSNDFRVRNPYFTKQYQYAQEYPIKISNEGGSNLRFILYGIKVYTKTRHNERHHSTTQYVSTDHGYRSDHQYPRKR